MKNKYPGEMVDPRILEEQAKQSQMLDKIKVSSLPKPIEDPLGYGDFDGDVLTITVSKDRGQGGVIDLHRDFSNFPDLNVIDGGIPNEHINECSRILHPSGKTNYAMQIFTEALVKNIERAEDIYTAQVINAYTRERGPFDFSLEAELANIVDLEDILEIKTCPPFVPEVINGNNRHYVGKGMTRDDFFKKDHNHPLLTEEHLHTPITVNPEDVRQLTEVIDDVNVEKPVKVAILGAPRLQAEYLIAACKDAGIEVTQRAAYDESNLIGDIDMKMLSTAALGMKHLSANPYSDGRKPHVESEIDSNRKLDRTRQKNLNKKQGYGKRLTKKDKLVKEQKHNYTETYLVERTDILEVDPSTGKTKVINNE